MGKKSIDIFAVEVEHHLSAVFSLDIDCIMGGIEAFLIDLADIVEGDVEVVEGFILEGLDAHVVEGSTVMG